MPQLILSGGSGIKEEKDTHKLFLKLVNKEPILYIPIAREQEDYSECYDWISSQLPAQDIKMLISFKDQKISLKDFKGIYIGGGNTFKLLKEIKENNFDEELKNFKGIIYGGSAGAIIFGKTVETATWGQIKDKNKVKLKDLSALNLLNYHNIRTHYLKKEEEYTRDFVKKTKIPIIALPEDSGIYINNKKIKNINKVYYFNDL